VPKTSSIRPPVFIQCRLVTDRQTDGQSTRANTATSFVDNAIDLPWRNLLTPGFRTMSQRKQGSSYSIAEHRVPELIPVLGSQSAGDVNHTPDGRLPLPSARPAVTPATLKRTATYFAAW